MIGLMVLSLALQIVAIVLALRLAKPTRREIGWAFVAVALVLTGFRRATTLYSMLTSDFRSELLPEFIAIAMSLCMIFAMILLDPYLQSARQSSEDLSKKERRLRALIEAVPDLLFVFDDDGKFLEVVSTHSRGLSLPPEQALGRNIREFMAPEQAEHFVATLKTAARTREMQVVEYQVTRNDVTRWWESRIVALADHELLVMGRDVSDRKQAEDDRLRLETKLQQAQKMESLGVLSGGIAHDFNNLLTGVLGNASLAIMKLTPGSPALTCLQQIETMAQRAGELTKQLLAYAGKGKFLVQPIALAIVVEEMADLLKTVISKKATLNLNFEPDVPNIRADVTQLRQIVMNLITNASDSLGESSGVIGLHTGVMFAEAAYLQSTFVEGDVPEGRYVFLEVTDTGAGMSEDVQRRIFDPFFTTKFTGRGLGLAAVLGIVRGHKGAIKVYSEPNKGTTFKVLFPADESDEPSIELTPPVTDDWRGSGTVLVVDDEEAIRNVAQTTLGLAGFEVLLANNGAEAVDLYRRRGAEIRCVLLDLTMPVMGGGDAFRELRTLDPGVNVVLMSGYNQQDVTNQFAGKGLAGFIQKPFRARDLLATIRVTMESRGSS